MNVNGANAAILEDLLFIGAYLEVDWVQRPDNIALVKTKGFEIMDGVSVELILLLYARKRLTFTL
jgi:hypothetical protein